MKQKEMSELVKVNDRTLRNWKKNRVELYKLLENLDFEQAKKLLVSNDKETYIKFLENEKYFTFSLDFEKELYPLLINRNFDIWKKLAFDTSLTKQARMRSAYLYSYLTRKPLKLKFNVNNFKDKPSFYHNNKTPEIDGIAKMYGLKNGLDNLRFNQFKTTGSF